MAYSIAHGLLHSPYHRPWPTPWHMAYSMAHTIAHTLARGLFRTPTSAHGLLDGIGYMVGNGFMVWAGLWNRPQFMMSLWDGSWAIYIRWGME